MTRHRIACLGLGALIVSSGAFARADDLQSSLEATYAAQCADIESGNWAAFAATLAPSYQGANLQGPPDTRTSEPSSIQSMIATFGLTKCSVKIVAAHQGADGIDAEVYFTLSGIAPKDLHRVKKGDALAFTFHSADVWTDSGPAREQLAAKTLDVAVTRNGTPLK